MDILNLFINFIEHILSFEILGIDLFTFLITITIITLIFSIIKAMSNSKGSTKK